MIDPNTPLDDLFYEDYFGVRWTAPGESRTITWSWTNDILDIPNRADRDAVRDITPYLTEIETAFTLWDAALDTVTFQRVDGGPGAGNAADVTVAITDLGGRGGNWAFWNSRWVNDVIQRGTIQFDVADIDQISVLTIAMHEVGNILGLGDILPSSAYRSVQEDPIPDTFTGTTLWADDVGLIRRYYDEPEDAPLAEVRAGDDGADVFVGAAGDDIIIGGGGSDTLRLAADIDGYALTYDDTGTLRLNDRGQGATGNDELRSVERLDFDGGNVWFPDGRVDTEALTGIAELSADQISLFVEMYVAYFDRAPDAIGLSYWGTRLSDGMPLEDIAESFFDQPETQALYPDDLDNRDLVRTAYDNFLERAPDLAGEEYWTAELDSGFSRGKFMLALINGARDNPAPEAQTDVATIEAKAEIGLHFAAIHGLTDLDAAEAVMQTYARDDASSQLEAFALTDDYAEAASAPGSAEAFTFSLVGIVDDPSAGLV
ncbi:MAG: DUF4214 domain-containing protein [Pseudomonadota bacterium]